MENTARILEELSRLNLSTYPVSEIRTLISQLGTNAIMLTTIRKGESIVRARVNEGHSFYNVRDLSYKPAKYNNKFQRASVPNSTVFYGAIFKDQYLKPDAARIIGLCEASPLWRNNNTYGSISDGEEIITFGKWDIIKDLNLVVIFNHDDFKNNNEIIKSVADSFIEFSKDKPKDVVEKSRLISHFFANEFAKKEINYDYDYLISAIYSDILMNFNLKSETIHGILYPSVRSDYKGCNVALNPRYVDDCLSLSSVIECSIYAKNSKIILDNDKITEVSRGSNKFKLKFIQDDSLRMGRDKVLKELSKWIGSVTVS